MRRGLRDRRYFASVRERFGRLPRQFDQTAPGALWLHAVSVGEVLTSVELVRRLKHELPGTRVFVSTTTLAGRATADQRFAGIADGVFYAPLDYRFAVRSVLRRLKPALVVVLETEIWPNLYREAKRFGCSLAIVNGRISDKAIGRYERFRWFFNNALRWPDAILAQDEIAAERFRRIGAKQAMAAGNLKYDFDPRQAEAPQEVVEWIRTLRPGRIWMAASTMPPAKPGDVDEDDVVIEAFRSLAASHQDLLLILVPRKPERFDEVDSKLRQAGVRFIRRTRLASCPSGLPAVLLLDSIGELSGLFPFAEVVFMGGTLARRGGHNILEPAAFEKAVIAGPHMENFYQIAEEFTESGALLRIGEPLELTGAVGRLLDDTEFRKSVARRAREQAEAKRGATARAVELIVDLHAAAVPGTPDAWGLAPFAGLWSLGGAWKRRSDLARQKRLNTPVVSVGGLNMGGTGKTPFVLWLARRLENSGEIPAILTRGYRRRSAEKVTVLAPGAAAPVTQTGDEAQIFVRAGVAPIGISSNRFEAGSRIEDEFHPSVFLLDDGFQHFRLARDCDIVLIDVLDPFGGGVFPRGRLREPEEALARASVFVLTRTEAGRRYDGIEHRLRKTNARAPIFRSSVMAKGWRTASGTPAHPPVENTAAFCGLANPFTFFRSVEAAGIRPVWTKIFPDHHRYTPEEIRDMASRTSVLLTTEKDLVNVPEDLRENILWLEIDLQVEGEVALLEWIRASLKHGVAS